MYYIILSKLIMRSDTAVGKVTIEHGVILHVLRKLTNS